MTGCNCSKDSVCLNSNKENFCKGLVESETLKEARLMVKNFETEVTAKLSRPQIANAISQKLKEHGERGF